jgi:hypothetical protein
VRRLRRSDLGAASGADLTGPADRVAVPRLDPLFDQVASRDWCRQQRRHWRRPFTSIGSPTGTPPAIVVEVVDRLNSASGDINVLAKFRLWIDLFQPRLRPQPSAACLKIGIWCCCRWQGQGQPAVLGFGESFARTAIAWSLIQVFWGVLIVVRGARMVCYLLWFLPVLGPPKLLLGGPLCPT